MLSKFLTEKTVFGLLSFLALIANSFMAARRILDYPYVHNTGTFVSMGPGPPFLCVVKNFNIVYYPPIPDYVVAAVLLLFPFRFVMLLFRKPGVTHRFPVIFSGEQEKRH